MKEVLISIKPYYVFLIIAKSQGWSIGQNKTIEVRKTQPKDWNKTAYIYCTKDKKSFAKIPKEYQPLMKKFLGKVIGEFVCDEIEEYQQIYDETISEWLETSIYEWNISDKSLDCTCLDIPDLDVYSNDKSILYGWHISDLKIYDKSKWLWEFCRNCNPCYGANCRFCKTHNGNRSKILQHPPQSWCYVERIDA